MTILMYQKAAAQWEDPWNVFSMLRNVSGLWTYNLQIQWNTVDICQNGGKIHGTPFCIFLYVHNDLKIPDWFSRMLRIPTDVKNSEKYQTYANRILTKCRECQNYSSVCIFTAFASMFWHSPDFPVSITNYYKMALIQQI